MIYHYLFNKLQSMELIHQICHVSNYCTIGNHQEVTEPFYLNLTGYKPVLVLYILNIFLM